MPPQSFYPLAGRWHLGFWRPPPVLAIIGLYVGFFVAPTDFQQGESYRIIFIHVPAAWMSMFIYVVMAFWAAVGSRSTPALVHDGDRARPDRRAHDRHRLVDGSLWGRPTWGTWWVWDARLTSELILLFLYFGFMSLQAAIDEPRRADKAARCSRSSAS
jgi:heme exporter protein C